MSDERDELNNGHNIRTYIWDMLDLDKPQILGFYEGSTASIGHNLYVKENYAYLTNYTSVSNTQIYEQCSSNVDLIFADGFD
ncbi:MAG: hypothetical protein L3J52_04655 [Proteobacteria bacterium]|nr:hypothetical protein [Pseudomonadota bacterium]